MTRPGVLDYQVHQTHQGIDVDVLTFLPIDTYRLSVQLADALVAAGLRQPRVTVAVVDQLARQKDSGKVVRFLAR